MENNETKEYACGDLVKKRIMRRVYAMWVCRSITSPMAIKLFVLFFSLWYARAYVSYKDVLYNSPSFFDVAESEKFWIYAVTHADLPTQFLLAGVLTLGGWLIYDFSRRLVAGARYAALSQMKKLDI